VNHLPAGLTVVVGDEEEEEDAVFGGCGWWFCTICSWGAASRGDRCTKGGASASIFCVDCIVFDRTLEVKFLRIVSLVLLLLFPPPPLLFFEVVVLLLDAVVVLPEEALLFAFVVEDDVMVAVRPSCS